MDVKWYPRQPAGRLVKEQNWSNRDYDQRCFAAKLGPSGRDRSGWWDYAQGDVCGGYASCTPLSLSMLLARQDKSQEGKGTLLQPPKLLICVSWLWPLPLHCCPRKVSWSMLAVLKIYFFSWLISDPTHTHLLLYVYVRVGTLTVPLLTERTWSRRSWINYLCDSVSRVL